MSLISGLTIIERYNHSIDLYADETRFTPLGTDAAVVYGYKDLRVQNSFAFPIQFKINLNHHTIQITLISTEKIVERKLNFEILDQNDSITVSVISDHQERFNVSTYKKLINLPLS
jgi:vancomycin resistance protein VanW